MKKLSIFIFFLIFSQLLFSETTDTSPKPYDKEEIPLVLQDIRRFEIVSLGSMPFVMMDATLVYSGVRWMQNGFPSDKAPTPFPGNSQFTSEEQMGLVFTSLGISVGIGLTDFIFRLIDRNSKNKKQKQSLPSEIVIIPVSEDPDAIHIEHLKPTDSEIIEVEVDKFDDVEVI